MNEHQQLLASVQHWFNHVDQVLQYTQEATSGVTALEHALLATLQTHDHILDCGCGAGRVVRVLAQRGCRVVGVDISHALLHRAAQTTATVVPHPAYLQIEPLQLPFQDASFDSVVAIKLYGYLPTHAARVRYLHELARLLRVGGTVRMLNYLVFADELHYAYDATYQHIAPQFTILEAGDTFTTGAAGGGYVHWFTEPALRAELLMAPLVLEHWEDDRAYGGQGYQAIAQLRKA